MKSIYKLFPLKFILFFAIAFITRKTDAQIKTTSFAINHSNAKIEKEIESTSTTEFLVKKKKWKPNKKIKKLKKNKLDIYLYENGTISKINKFAYKKDKAKIKSTFSYNEFGDLTENVNANSQILFDTIKIENKYNNQGHLDSINYFSATKYYRKKVFLYNSNGSVKNEFIHTFSDKKGYLLTKIVYEYLDELLSKKTYYQYDKEQPIVQLIYEYNDKKLVTKITNKFPSLIFPEETKYEYDQQLKIIKEIINYGKFGKDTYEYIYENDNSGNWIKQIRIFNGKIDSFYEREINYIEKTTDNKVQNVDSRHF